MRSISRFISKSVYVVTIMLIWPFCFYVLDLDLITLIYELDLNIIGRPVFETYVKFLGQCFQKLEHEQHRLKQTDKHTDQRDRTHYDASFADSNNSTMCRLLPPLGKHRLGPSVCLSVCLKRILRETFSSDFHETLQDKTR